MCYIRVKWGVLEIYICWAVVSEPLGTCCANIFIFYHTYISSTKALEKRKPLANYKSIVIAFQTRVKAVNRRVRGISLSAFALCLFAPLLPHQIRQSNHLRIDISIVGLLPAFLVICETLELLN